MLCLIFVDGAFRMRQARQCSAQKDCPLASNQLEVSIMCRARPPVATLELTEKSSLKFCVVSGAVQDARSYTLTYANTS